MSPTTYFVTLRLHATGTDITPTFDSAIGRALFIISTSLYADVVAMGEK